MRPGLCRQPAGRRGGGGAEAARGAGPSLEPGARGGPQPQSAAEAERSGRGSARPDRAAAAPPAPSREPQGPDGCPRAGAWRPGERAERGAAPRAAPWPWSGRCRRRGRATWTC